MILFKGKKKSVTLFYALTLAIGLIVALWSHTTGFKAIEGGEKEETAVDFFILVLLYTAVFLGIILLLGKYVRLLIFVLELFFLWTTSTFLFSLISELAGLFWGLLLTLIRILFREEPSIRNLSVAIIAGVSGGLLGASLLPPVALLLYVAMLTYDFVAVFLTRHMVVLAKSIEPGLGSGKFVALGAGDAVVPLLFSTSLVNVSPILSVLSSVYSLVGLSMTFYFLKRFKRPLPALPYIAAVHLTLTAITLFLATPFL